MLLDSIHTLAKLALKETVPPQPRASPHVTAVASTHVTSRARLNQIV